MKLSVSHASSLEMIFSMSIEATISMKRNDRSASIMTPIVWSPASTSSSVSQALMKASLKASTCAILGAPASTMGTENFAKTVETNQSHRARSERAVNADSTQVCGSRGSNTQSVCNDHGLTAAMKAPYLPVLCSAAWSSRPNSNETSAPFTAMGMSSFAMWRHLR